MDKHRKRRQKIETLITLEKRLVPGWKGPSKGFCFSLLLEFGGRGGGVVDLEGGGLVGASQR